LFLFVCTAVTAVPAPNQALHCPLDPCVCSTPWPFAALQAMHLVDVYGSHRIGPERLYINSCDAPSQALMLDIDSVPNPLCTAHTQPLLSFYPLPFPFPAGDAPS
jgi:hypothetical protein